MSDFPEFLKDKHGDVWTPVEPGKTAGTWMCLTNENVVDRTAQDLARAFGPMEPTTWQQANGDPVNHPRHYIRGGLECLDVIEALQLPYHLGNVLKYLWRWDMKGGLEDLKKAQVYLDRYIKLMEKKAEMSGVKP